MLTAQRIRELREFILEYRREEEEYYHNPYSLSAQSIGMEKDFWL